MKVKRISFMPTLWLALSLSGDTHAFEMSYENMLPSVFSKCHKKKWWTIRSKAHIHTVEDWENILLILPFVNLEART